MASFVPVLPTEPVIATIFASVRLRAARPSPRMASSTSGTTISLSEPAKLAAFSSDTIAADAPFSSAACTKSWPSWTSPLMAK